MLFILEPQKIWDSVYDFLISISLGCLDKAILLHVKFHWFLRTLPKLIIDFDRCFKHIECNLRFNYYTLYKVKPPPKKKL